MKYNKIPKDKHDEFIELVEKKNYSIKELRAKYGVSENCVRNNCKKLGIKVNSRNKHMKKVFEVHEKFIIENYESMTIREMSEALNLKRHNIYNVVAKNELNKDKVGKIRRNRGEFTVERKAFIDKNSHILCVAQLAQVAGLEPFSVYSYLYREKKPYRLPIFAEDGEGFENLRDVPTFKKARVFDAPLIKEVKDKINRPKASYSNSSPYGIAQELLNG